MKDPQRLPAHADDDLAGTSATDAYLPAPASPARRDFLQRSAAGVAGLMAGSLTALHAPVWAAGSDKPEKTEVKVGFIPLTDCASLVVAAEMGFDKKHGIRIVLSKEASWAAVRDKLSSGELDAAHVLYGLIYGVQTGVGGKQKDMAALMTLNRNGQGITLSNQVRDKGVTDGAGLRRLIQNENRDFTFAQTFPTGTHAMWLYYWLAAYGIHPMKDVKTIVVPPPQMVANMRIGNMDGFCVGEPWNARAVWDKIGFTAATSQDIWTDHPEKVLGTTAEFADRHPNTARALVAAVLEASKYIDDMTNRSNVAKLICQKSYVNTDFDVIEDRMLGEYQNGLGKKWQDKHYMKFHDDGAVNFPYLSDGMWFLTQHKRWGLLKDHPDYLGLAQKVNRIGIYTEAAAAARVTVPKDPMRKSKLIDGSVWDGSNPKAYADSFKIKA